MAVDTRESGRITKWMGEAFSIGLTTGGMRENMLMIRRKDSAISRGLMGGSTKADGSMENSMERESTSQVLVKSEKVCGTMENG